MSVVTATRHPSPSPPMRALSGMRTSVKKTSLNSASPVIWKSGRTSTPGRLHVDEEGRHPLVLGHVGVGARHDEPERRDVRQRRPHLLPVEHPLVAVTLGPGRQPGHVRAGARLAEQLAPDLLAREEGAQVALLLLGRPVGDDGGGAHAVADRVPHSGHRGAARMEARLGPLMVPRGQAEPAAAGAGSAPRPGRGRTAPRGTAVPACVAGGRSASRPSTSSSTFALMPAPYSVLSCGHLLIPDGSALRARTRPPARRAPGAVRHDGLRHAARRQGARLRGVRGPRRLPRPQLPRRPELPTRRRAGTRGRRGQGRPPRLPRPPRHGALDLPAGAPPDRLAGRRRAAHRGARDRALRRDGLVGRRPLRGRLRGQDGRPRHRGRAPVERGAPRPLRHDPGAHRGGPRPLAPDTTGARGWPPPS